MNDMLDGLAFWIIALLLGFMCMAVALRCFGWRSVFIGRREVPLERELGVEGERFTPRMGLAAACWGVGVLCAYLAASAIFCAVTRESASWSGLYDVWKQWDATNYRTLAELGYRDYTDAEHLYLVFFPLYPWLVRLLAKLIPNYDLCGHLLSGLCFVGSCYMLSRLVTEEFGKKAGTLSLALFSAYPFSFFFAAYYTESLFVLLSLITFYCIRRHRYLLSGVFGALAALTRMQGVLFAVVAMAEWIASEHPVAKLRAGGGRRLLPRYLATLLCMALVGAGTLVYLGLNYYVEGNPLQFTIYQREHWFQGFQLLPKCIELIWGYLLAKLPEKTGFTIWLPDFAVFVACFAAALYGIRRLPPSWSAYFLLALMLNYSLSWPLSCGRYMSSAFPLPVVAALALRRRPMLANFAIAACTVLQGAYLFIFLSGGPVY